MAGVSGPTHACGVPGLGPVASLQLMRSARAHPRSYRGSSHRDPPVCRPSKMHPATRVCCVSGSTGPAGLRSGPWARVRHTALVLVAGAVSPKSRALADPPGRVVEDGLVMYCDQDRMALLEVQCACDFPHGANRRQAEIYDTATPAAWRAFDGGSTLVRGRGRCGCHAGLSRAKEAL